MTDFVLVHGAGSAPSYWYLVAPELRRQGHQVLTPELPCDDETAGLGDYGDAIATLLETVATLCSSPSLSARSALLSSVIVSPSSRSSSWHR